MSQQPTLIITGGSSTIAQHIGQYWKKHHTDWLTLVVNRSVLDVTDTNAVQEYFSNHKCDLLVCAAGISDNSLLRQTSATAFEKSLQVNLHAAANCAVAAAKRMAKQMSGHILFLSSYSAYHPPSGQVAYATSKGALLGLTQDFAKEWGPYNIRVNTILPGWIDSPMTQIVSEKRRSQVLAEHTLKRWNTSENVAAFVSHLHHYLVNTSGQIFNLDSRII